MAPGAAQPGVTGQPMAGQPGAYDPAAAQAAPKGGGKKIVLIAIGIFFGLVLLAGIIFLVSWFACAQPPDLVDGAGQPALVRVVAPEQAPPAAPHLLTIGPED
jgi:hypothetical protein